MSKAKKKRTEPEAIEDGWAVIKDLNSILKKKLPEFQRTEIVQMPQILPPAEELQELKLLIEWCLKLWAEHDGFLFRPGPYYNE
jgi:hypothetical protein